MAQQNILQVTLHKAKAHTNQIKHKTLNQTINPQKRTHLFYCKD